MAYSRNKTIGDGSTKIFSVTFPYLSQSHVEVRIDGTLTTAWTWLTTSTIQLSVAPPSGSVVEVRRNSSASARIVDFQDASLLTEKVLDQSADQLFYLAQEAFDAASEAFIMTSGGTYDAAGRRVTGLGDPVAATDAVNKNYVDNTAIPLMNQTVQLINNNQTVLNTVQAKASDISTVAAELSNSVYTNDLGSITDSASGVGGTGNLNTVATNINDVKTVSSNLSTVQTTSSNIAGIQTVAANISGVQTVQANITSIQNAASNAASASASLDEFKKRYQGSRSSDPGTRYDGSALSAGDLYFNTVTNMFKSYTGTVWANASSADGAALTDGTVTLAKLTSTLDLGTLP